MRFTDQFSSLMIYNLPNMLRKGEQIWGLQLLRVNFSDSDTFWGIKLPGYVKFFSFNHILISNTMTIALFHFNSGACE